MLIQSPKCHADIESHKTIFCNQNCTRLCPRGHPCQYKCGLKPCGKCNHPIYNIMLPCGHMAKSVPWYALLPKSFYAIKNSPSHSMENLEAIKCVEVIEKALLSCEHRAQMRCSDDVSKYKCESICNGVLACCSNTCSMKCFSCQDKGLGNAPLAPHVRTRHQAHKCGKPLFCEHTCPGMCSADHKCLDLCSEPCRQRCTHGSCEKRCSDPCRPCQQSCEWYEGGPDSQLYPFSKFFYRKCLHEVCQVPCGAVS